MLQLGLSNLSLAQSSPEIANDALPVESYDAKSYGAKFLSNYCYDCHGDGATEGNLSLGESDQLSKIMGDQKLWAKVWDNVLTEAMPPASMPQPTWEERKAFSEWIATEIYHLDPNQPDPGRVVIRRLNRAEYHYAVKDLTGIHFSVADHFPPDDSGYGFDTIGDVLTMSPTLFEKYFQAAEMITEKIVIDTIGKLPVIESRKGSTDSDSMSPWNIVPMTLEIAKEGDYNLTCEITAGGAFSPYYGVVDLELRLDDQTLFATQLSSDKEKAGETNCMINISQHLAVGSHQFSVRYLEHSEDDDEKEESASRRRSRKAKLNINRLVAKGPTDSDSRVYGSSYHVIFPKGLDVPASEQEAYAREILTRLVTKAYRRPASKDQIERLMALFNRIRSTGEMTFTESIAQCLTGILVSPKFLMREELAESSEEQVELIDEFALASRLSFFFWSSLPDDQLLDLASRGQLRAQLDTQVSRMIEDQRSHRLTENFVGQWLQNRDITATYKSDRSFSYGIRDLMRQETEHFFDHILNNNRPVIELITADYTFLNKSLSDFYDLDDLTDSSEFQKVQIPKEYLRGGILTQGSILAITSNPNRTSPVKRGKFILENILGTPPPPPPAAVPDLEDAKHGGVKPATLREQLAIHREDPGCASCHDRMDPLGLAFENFDTLGKNREKDNGEPIDASGQLSTGETFTNVSELREILGTRKRGFYRCLTQKLMIYALGRGLEPSDTPTVEAIVDKLCQDQDGLQDMIGHIVHSPQFQMRRVSPTPLVSAN